MPSELRHLLFRPAEVVQAVKEYYRRTGKVLPTSTVVRCCPESEGAGCSIKFRITIAPDRPDPKQPMDTTQQDVVIDGAALAAALILSCRDRRIPLPAHANKSLQLFGAQICLLVAINPKQDEMPSVLTQ